MAIKIEGKTIAQDILRDVAVVANVMQKRVCFVQFGDDAASIQFIARKQRVALTMGIQADVVEEKHVTTTEEALAVLTEVIKQEYDGIVVQLPLPYGIDTDTLLNAIPVAQDIDVLGKESLQLFERGEGERMPPVAGAVDTILRTEQIDLADKKIVIVGKGRLVGAPIALLFDRRGIAYDAIDITTAADTQKTLLAAADIIISGIGVPLHLKPPMIKDCVVLLDAGTSQHNGVMVGDIDPACYDKASYYTPVPGGIGPITVALLCKNLFL